MEKKYIKGEAIKVTSGVDGINWSPEKTIHVDKETSGLWAFPVAYGQIGIAVSYNNFYVKWLVSRTPERFSIIDSSVNLLLETQNIHFFVRDEKIYCVRPVHDFVEEQGVALVMSSKKDYKRLFR